MTREEMTRFWGRDNLARWSEVSLRNVTIPGSAKSFLVETGMPLRLGLTLRFEIQADQVSRASTTRLCIGFDDVVPISIDERGRVIAEEAKVGRGEKYINSSIECFGECLVYYQQYRISVRAASEDEVQRLISVVARSLRNTEPTAFADPNNWWPVIVEQINHGLL